jgi:integrase
MTAGAGRPEGVHASGGQACPRSEEQGSKARTKAKRPTKWTVAKGYHVLRYSFISALSNKGIVERIIDELVGHQTEAMRRHYRHLYPQTVANAVKKVFG